MRKRVLALVCCGALFFSACQVAGPEGSRPGSAAISAAPPASSEVLPGAEPAGPLRVLWNGNHYADDVPGSIETQALANDGGEIILYNSYETGIQAPLCSNGACTHNGPGCNAYLPSAWQGDKMLLAGPYLFIADAYNGRYIPETDAPFYLVRYGLDGSGGEVVLELPGALMMSDAILTDDRYLYFDVGNAMQSGTAAYGNWSMGPGETCLMRVDIESGQPENLRPMTGRNLLGVAADGRLLMWDTTSGTPALVAGTPGDIGETRLKPLPAEFESVNTDDARVLYNGWLYKAYSGTGSSGRLMAYDPLAGEVVFDVPLEQFRDIRYICGGYVAIRNINLDFERETDGSYYPDTSGYYTWLYVDAKTGEQLEMPLYVEYPDPRPLNANFEDSPTVGGQAAILFGTWKGGYALASGYYLVPYYSEVFGDADYSARDTYSVISEADYWAGKDGRADIAPFVIDTTATGLQEVTDKQQRLLAFGAVLAQRNGFGFNRAGILPPMRAVPPGRAGPRCCSSPGG